MPYNLRLVILGRDGILNVYREDHVKAPEEWQPVPGALEAVARLNHAGWHVVVATNQAGIGRGMIDMASLNSVHQRMMQRLAAVGGRLDAVFFCPHTPEDNCECRKPRPGLMKQIGSRYGIELRTVPMVCDTLRDLLAAQASEQLVHVSLSITSLDGALTRALEPRTSAPAARLRAITALREAGVPVGVMVAPVIPGLTDHELPAILEAASQAGAVAAGFTLLRLPESVGPLFLDWLERHRPLARQRVEGLIRSTRGGALDDARFGCRMRGDAAYADGIAASFKLFARKWELDRPRPPLDVTRFRPPRTADGQAYLF